ncbi:hypothetical protein Dsin_006913 [Dipteronia sinensis]|uniref:AMP-dependent synthetase/ligase domain-containing protein n=1 Tax=Dipteronia sinensis TaxID=43782 RepID=A0AAE0AZ75_9ROSI|nr:hypothetical protein Dsin_006913 [Dipteronia sinensis]
MENLTLTGLLRKAAKEFSNRRALSVSGKFDVTYSRLQELVEHAASLLVAHGVKPGDVVALVFPNTLEYVVMFLAVIRCRATAAPLNSAYTMEEFEFYLSDSESKLLITPREGIQTAKSAASKLNIPQELFFSNVNVFIKGPLFTFNRGAFKFRGACNAVLSLDDDEASKGVVTHSSGNHAAALALAAKMRGIPAYIVIPRNIPKCKVENVSGQGTISLEFLDQVPQPDTIIVPISGGGLISGVTLAAKSINPHIRILTEEPMGANDAAGRIITFPETNTAADGLRAFLGYLTCCSFLACRLPGVLIISLAMITFIYQSIPVRKL